MLPFYCDFCFVFRVYGPRSLYIAVMSDDYQECLIKRNTGFLRLHHWTFFDIMILLFHVIFVDFEIWLKFMGFTRRKVE